MPSDGEIRQILSGPGTSHWIKNAFTTALDRDPGGRGERRVTAGHRARAPGRPDHGHVAGGARCPGRDQAGENNGG
jgi:hypothetical protein